MSGCRVARLCVCVCACAAAAALGVHIGLFYCLDGEASRVFELRGHAA